MTNRIDVAALEDDDLSALVDGELGAAATARVCGQWRSEPGVRNRWHEYQLIGDVLRSEELASTAVHDNAFLLALRSRMASEPILVAPIPASAAATVAAAPAGRSRAVTFGAIAAGFVVVAAGAVTILGQPFGGGLAPAGPPIGTLAQSKPALVASTSVLVRPDAVGELQPTVASGQLIRDAKLDSYLSAHRQWSDGAMLGGHAAYLRYNPGEGSNR